jgi:hypothetical protein
MGRQDAHGGSREPYEYSLSFVICKQELFPIPFLGGVVMNYPGHIVVPITFDELLILAKDLGQTRIMRRGKGVFTCCPAPDHGDDGRDENPSLWLGIAPSGKTLAVSCKAGCDRNAVAAELQQCMTRLGLGNGGSTIPYIEDNDWEQLDYAPAGAEPQPMVMAMREWSCEPTSNGKVTARSPQRTWVYRNPEGLISHVVARWDGVKDGKKVKAFADVVWCRNKKTGKEEWQTNWYPTVFNLLWSELLAEFPGKPVLVVEGEKAAEAARARWGDRYFVTTWALGMAEAHRPDWSILKGRSVVLWADKDDPGHEAMRVVAARLVKAGVEDVKMVVLS